MKILFKNRWLVKLFRTPWMVFIAGIIIAMLVFYGWEQMDMNLMVIFVERIKVFPLPL